MRAFLVLLFTLTTLLGATMRADDTQMRQQTVLILLGPPGSGKGTQATQLTKKLDIPHISTGDLFRDNIKGNTPLGQKAKSFMDAGKLVPDEVVLEMLFDRIARPDSAKGFLLDGFPRTIPQAEAFEQYVTRNHMRVIVFSLDVPDDVIIRRAANRLTCSTCGNVYNKSFSSPTIDGICDKCAGTLTQRSDDQPEVVKERLRVYHAQTKPLIKYYQNKDVLTTFDGTKPPQEVLSELLSALSSLIGVPFKGA